MWKKVLFVVFLLSGIAGFCAIPFIVGVRETLTTIREVGWRCVCAYVLVAAGVLIIPAMAWWLLMRSEGIPVSPLQAIRANLMGAPLNFFTPSAYLGGEPLKMVYISRVAEVTHRRVLATIIAAKVQEVAGLLLLMFLAALYFVWRQDIFSRRNEILLIGLMVVIFGLFIALMVGFYRDTRPTVKFINFLAWCGISKRKLAPLRAKAEDMERIIHASLVHRWKLAVAAQAIVLFSGVTILIRPFVFFSFSPSPPPITLEDMCMIYVIVNLINTITLIPGSLGVLEGGVVGYFSLRGLGDHNAAAFMLINRVADAIFVSLGLWMIAHYGMTAIAKSVAKGTEKIEEKDLLAAAEAEEEKAGITHPPPPSAKTP